MPKKDATKTGRMLMYLLASEKDFEAVFPRPRKFTSDSVFKSYADFKNMVYHLQRRGLVKIMEQGSERIIKLTDKGRQEAMLLKARIPKKLRWDGKWRLVLCSFPVAKKTQRLVVAQLMKKNGFISMQPGVFISPHPLNRESLSYLETSGLIKYLRIIKVDEIDNDKQLRELFHLPVYI